MKKYGYDLIGDIHGHHEKLVNLLEALGYMRRGNSTHGWSHPKGRRVIFLGDYIDRGPAVRDVLLTVRSMVEAGDAHAILGNHEYNAVCWNTPDGKGGWLRERRSDRDAGLRETHRQFEDQEVEWLGWLDWFRNLPLFLELDGIRAVHACWDARRIERLRGRTLADEEFLFRSAVRKSPEHRAIENVLKGPEMGLPNGATYPDKDGIPRSSFRARWWDLPDKPTEMRDLSLPGPLEVDQEAPLWEIRRLPNYGPDEPPVFFGHYWRPADSPREPYRENVACLDYSAARGDYPLVAYRWNGEQVINRAGFVDSGIKEVSHA